ncbi:MAG TPA: ferritin family protein [Methanomassiliicoccales archaeon]
MASPANMSVLSILSAARQIEIFGIQFYSKVATCISDENGKALMRSLGADERTHKETIEEVMQHLSPGMDLDEVEPEKELLNILPKKVFPFPPEGTCLAVSDEIRAVNIGIDVEIASVKMYQEASALVDDLRIKNILITLTRIEEKHKILLESSLMMLKTEGSWYAYTPILDG